jgi:hypothetical protein
MKYPITRALVARLSQKRAGELPEDVLVEKPWKSVEEMIPVTSRAGQRAGQASAILEAAGEDHTTPGYLSARYPKSMSAATAILGSQVGSFGGGVLGALVGGILGGGVGMMLNPEDREVGAAGGAGVGAATGMAIGSVAGLVGGGSAGLAISAKARKRAIDRAREILEEKKHLNPDHIGEGVAVARPLYASHHKGRRDIKERFSSKKAADLADENRERVLAKIPDKSHWMPDEVLGLATARRRAGLVSAAEEATNDSSASFSNRYPGTVAATLATLGAVVGGVAGGKMSSKLTDDKEMVAGSIIGGGAAGVASGAVLAAFLRRKGATKARKNIEGGAKMNIDDITPGTSILHPFTGVHQGGRAEMARVMGGGDRSRGQRVGTHAATGSEVLALLASATSMTGAAMDNPDLAEGGSTVTLASSIPNVVGNIMAGKGTNKTISDMSKRQLFERGRSS